MPVYIIKENLKSYSSSKHTEISHNHNIAKKKKVMLIMISPKCYKNINSIGE